MANPSSIEQVPVEQQQELPKELAVSTDLDKIKKNISDIKSSVEQVTIEKESLEKEKANLAKEVLTQKEQALENKKNEIETKKKETLDLITKVKIDAKLVALDQQVSAEIEADEKYLNELSVDSPSFWEKLKATPGKIWDWSKENPKTAVAVTLGGILAVWGISKLFKKHKEKSESSDDKKEKPSWWKRALTWVGVGAAGTRLGRGLLTGKWDLFGRNPFSKDGKKPDGPETTPGSNLDSSIEAYQTLSEDKKTTYENLASNINTYYGNAMGDQAGVSGVEEQLGDSDFEQKDGQKIAGLVPFVLNNRYASVSAMLDEKAFYYEILGTEGHIVWDKMRNWGVDTLKTFVMPIAGLLDTATLNIIKTSDKVDDILNALKADPKAEPIMRTMFRKSLSVMSYMESRKRMLDYQIAREYLTAHNEDNFNTMDEEDKLEKIADMLDDEEWYTKNIEAQVSQFMNKSLLEATTYLQSKNLLDGEIDPLIQKAVAKVEDKRKDLLGIEDEDDESTIQLLKAELKEGKLSPKGKEKLVDLCNTFEYDIDNFGKKSWYNQYLPILELMNVDQDTLAKMQSTGDYDGVVKVYKDAIQSILKKSNDGTLTSADLDNLEAQVNDYYKFQKSLVTTQLNLSESRDQNGNVVSRYIATCVAGGETIVRGIQLVTKDGIKNKLQGAAAITGGVISLDLLTGTLITRKYSPARFVAKHILYPVGKGTLKLGALGVEKLTGKVLRTRLPYGLGARWFDEHSLRVAVCHGDIDLDRAAKVANRKEWKIASNGNSKVISTAEDYLQSLFPGKTAAEYTDATNLLKKYKSNPAVYEDIFKGTYDNKKFFKPKDWFKMDNKKMIFELDLKNLQRLKDIDHRIETFTNSTEKTIFRSMMRSAKNLDQAESLVTMSIEPEYLKLFESGSDGMVSAEKFGTYLAKYGKKIDADEMKAFQQFLLDSKAQRGSNPDLFLRNALRDFDHLKANIKDGKIMLTADETLKLTQSKWYRIAEETKTATNNMISKLSEFTKNPRLKPFWKGMNNQITALKEYVKTINPDGMRAIKDMKWLDNVTGFSKLSEDGISTMQKLKVLLDTSKGKDILKAIKSWKNVDNVGDLSAELKTIDASLDIEKVDIGILKQLASTKGAAKITDIINYGAQFKAISGVKKLVSNPALKVFAKRAMIGIDFAITGYDFYTGLEESQEIKKTNLARGEWREDQAYFDVVSGGLGAIAGACMFIPGAGWVAGGAMFGFMAVKEVGDKYYQDIAKFKQNYADFSRKELPAIKQELVSINAWGQGVDRTWIDKMSMFKGMRWAPTLGILGAVGSSSISEKEKGLKSTTTDAVKALLYVEEMQNYPAASYDLNSPDVLNNPELKTQVEEAKKAVDQQVKKRFEYIQTNYIAKGKPIVDVQAHTSDTGIAALDKLLQDSSVYTVASADALCKDKNNIPAYIKQKEMELKQLDVSGFAKLESLYKTNPTQLFLMYAQAPSYKAWLVQTGDSEQAKLLQNVEFFMQYMAYKTLGKSPLDFPKVDLNSSTIDYVPIHNLLSTFTLSATTYSGSEIASRAELLTDKQVLLRYGVSTNLGQNILYEIAQSLDYTGTNTLSDLKKFFNEGSKGIHGIYCTEEGQWRINEDNGLDNDFAKDEELNDLDKMQYFYEKILDASSSSFTGKMIEESSSNNRELAKKFSDIANSHINLRKNKSQIINEIKSYLSQHGSDQNYISIPLDMVLKGTKAGISNLGSCVYRIDHGNIVYKTTLAGVRPGF